MLKAAPSLILKEYCVNKFYSKQNTIKSVSNIAFEDFQFICKYLDELVRQVTVEPQFI